MNNQAAAKKNANSYALYKNLGKFLIHFILILGAFSMILPFVWMILMSFKTYAEATAIPIKWFPAQFSWDNYKIVFGRLNFGRYMSNTVFVTLVTTMLAMTAYVPAQLEGYTKVLGDKVAVAAFPYNTTRATITNCLGYVIPAGVSNLDAAKEFLVYLASEEGQKPQASAMIPAYQGITSAMEEKFASMNFSIYLKSGEWAVPTPVERYSGNNARKVLEAEVNNIMFENKDVAQALSDAEVEIKKISDTAKAEQGG